MCTSATMEGLTDVPAKWITSEGVRKGIDTICVEEALSISVSNGSEINFSLGVTMRTPGDDIHLVTGLLFSEGIINSYEQIIDFNFKNSDVTVIVSDLDEKTISDYTRKNTSTASCGVCGKESISNLLHIHGPEISKDFSIESSIVSLSTDKLRNQQKLFQDTGGTHACGLFDKNGNLLFIGEDIGRHNAMDKLVGNVLSNSADIFLQTFIIFSGRLSFELVHKARRAGISILVSIGAPSSLAIDIAVEHGLTIVGFAKNKNMTVYTGRARIKNS
tara:strand:+ start:1341 stop:2165 length:825 start_codon:yes stop_codon:yes gene_type:complete